MITCAKLPRGKWRSREAEDTRFRWLALILILWAGVASAPALAQVSGSIAIASESRWRGLSLSSGNPVASAAIGYDNPSGWYGDASATLVLSSSGAVQPIGAAIDAGYAWRDRSGTSYDIGLTRQQYTRHFSGKRSTGYTEVYAGLSGESLAGRLSYSPDYFASGSHALYGSIDGVIRPATDWRLTAHLGAVAYLSPIHLPRLRTVEYDVGVGLSRRIRAVELGVVLSAGGPDTDFYRGRVRSKTALVGSAAMVF